MAVADQIGVPVENESDAAATGTMRGSDDAAVSSNDGMEEVNTGEGPSR